MRDFWKIVNIVGNIAKITTLIIWLVLYWLN